MQNQIELTKQTPELLKDVKLFKLVLTPLELYVLKRFLSDLHPLNIREIYTHSIFTIFLNTFGNESDRTKSEQMFITDLVGAGYGGSVIDRQVAEKVIKEYARNKNLFSETKSNQFFFNKLKEYHTKLPSYEKFKAIVEGFENVGVVYKRTKQGKIILYGLNPNFYNLFKDKIQEIIKL